MIKEQAKDPTAAAETRAARESATREECHGGELAGALRGLSGAPGDGTSVAPSRVMQLQRTIGNRSVGAALDARRAGRSMRVGPSGGILEREADRAAERALRTIEAGARGSPAPSAAPLLPRGEPLVQRKGEREFTGTFAPEGVSESIERARGSGQPLAGALRGPLERAFGADFGGVRVHTGAHAEQLGRSLSAHAFTAGRDIFFGAGAYDPGSARGRHVLAHELAHVVQQGSASTAIQRLSLAELRSSGSYDRVLKHPEWPAEAEAYEKRLGAYCYNHPRARSAADRSLKRIHHVLGAYFTGTQQADIAGAFFKDDLSSAGQVGTRDAVNKLAVLFERGNLREQMTAFYNAAYYKAGYGADLGVSFKAILRDITTGGARFDQETSDGLGLDTKGLRAQADFLRGKTRRFIHWGLSKFKQDKAYTVNEDIFALGNLYYQHSPGWRKAWRNPFRALREMIGSQAPRIDRSAREKAVGSQKKTARDYAEMQAPLSEREREFLGSQGNPLVISEIEIDPQQVEGTHADADSGKQVTLTRDGDPGWGGAVERKNRKGTSHVETCVHRLDDEEHGTAQAVEITYGFASDEPVMNEDGSPKIARITYKQLILHPTESHLADGVQGPELPLEWVEGSAWFKFRESPGGWYDKIHNQLGMPVVAGVSGTTTRMMDAFKWLKVPGVDPFDFRLSLMGWMLTSWDHSLYEILSGSEYAGVAHGTERLDNVTQMYQNIHPLTKEELRAGACKDRMFPHEALYMKMARKPDDPTAAAPRDPRQMGAWTREQHRGRLVEPGSRLVDRAHETLLVLEDLAAEERNQKVRRSRPNVPRYLRRQAGAGMQRQLDQLGLSSGDAVQNLSEAHVTALMGYTAGYHHFLNDVISKSRSRALASIRSKLKLRFQRTYLQAELRRVEAKIRHEGKTEADTERKAELERQISAVAIPRHEDEWIATYDISAIRTLVEEVAASPPASTEREAALQRLWALVDATAERIYEEMLVHANMAIEGLEALPPAHGVAWRGDWKVGGRPRLSLVGSVVTFDSLTSASRDQRTAVGFALKYWSPVVMRIQLNGKGGRDIQYLSYHAGEREVLLLPGTQIRVAAVTTQTARLENGQTRDYKVAECVEV